MVFGLCKTEFLAILGLGIFLSRGGRFWGFEIWCFGFGSCLTGMTVSVLGLRLV